VAQRFGLRLAFTIVESLMARVSVYVEGTKLLKSVLLLCITVTENRPILVLNPDEGSEFLRL